jgi:uncharacterized protein YlzI (FlbEa/FlbD family)
MSEVKGFVSLNSQNGAVFVRADDIMAIISMEDGRTMVAFSNGKTVIVTESAANIMSAVEKQLG